MQDVIIGIRAAYRIVNGNGLVPMFLHVVHNLYFTFGLGPLFLTIFALTAFGSTGRGTSRHPCAL